MLLATVNREAAEAIGNVKKVGVGNGVVYHARAGYMRDRRSSFPAFVLRQHEDGSLDLLVFMEREDFATEEHVHFRSHNQPHHCWSAVEDAPGSGQGVTNDFMNEVIKSSTFQPDVGALLAPLLARIEALEAKRGRGRPPKSAKKATQERA